MNNSDILFDKIKNTYEGIKCPKCGQEHKILSKDGGGWWAYVVGKWACDCGANGKIWYLGDKVSRLSE